MFDLSSKSMGLSLGVCPLQFPLVVPHTISLISFPLWCALGGNVWIWMKSNLFRFIEGQTHFSTSWHFKMSLTLNQWRMFFVQSSTLPPSMHCKLTEHGRCCMQNNHNPTKGLTEIKEYSIECGKYSWCCCSISWPLCCITLLYV